MESGPLIGAIVGGVIACYSARFMSVILARMQAGAKLRAAFAPEIAQMRLLNNGINIAASGQRIDCEQMLASSFPKHAAAIEEFIRYLSKQEREKYYKAWRDYYEVGGSIRFYNYYMGKGSEPYELFFTRVDNILQFTEDVGILKYLRQKRGI